MTNSAPALPDGVFLTRLQSYEAGEKWEATFNYVGDLSHPDAVMTAAREAASAVFEKVERIGDADIDVILEARGRALVWFPAAGVLRAGAFSLLAS